MDSAWKQKILFALQFLCFASTVVLLIVWPLPDTIAARNICLYLGATAGALWILLVRPSANIHVLLPSLLLMGVPGWLWIHYFSFPVDLAAQWYDLTGTWLRVILGLIMATTMGFMIFASPKKIYWIFGALSILSLLTFGQYLIEVSRADSWIIADFKGPYKYKSAVVYFIMWPCLWAFSLMHLAFIKAADARSPKKLLAYFGVLLATICFVDFIAARALNGVLISGAMGLVLITVFARHFFSTFVINKKTQLVFFGSITIVIFATFSTFWHYDQKYEQKLSNLVGDIIVAVQIDSTTIWQRDSRYQGPNTPNDSSGRAVNGSTYERAAWFVKGLRVLKENPLGAGYSHLAFKHFMQIENPYAMLTKTHSGWLDFALGVGLPGLLLSWAALACAILGALKCKDSSEDMNIAIPTLWILIGMWLLWWPAEISEREFIEQFFFMVAFLGTVTGLILLSQKFSGKYTTSPEMSFDIYVIHNYSLKERRHFLEALLARYPSVHFVEIENDAPEFINQTYQGVNEARWSERAVLWKQKITPRKLNQGEIACTASHFYAYQHFLSKSNKEWILVLEDDAIFKENFGVKIQRQLRNIPDIVGAVFIGGGFPQQKISLTLGTWKNFLIKHHPATNTTIGYMLRRSTVEKVMRDFSTFDMPIDYELAYLLMRTNTLVFHQNPYSIKEGSKLIYSSSIRDLHNA